MPMGLKSIKNKQIHKRTNKYKLLRNGHQVGEYKFAYGCKLKVMSKISMDNVHILDVQQNKWYFKDINGKITDITKTI